MEGIANDETLLEQTLADYTSQLEMVDMGLSAATDQDEDQNDLKELKTKLLEIMELTKQDLFNLKKANLYKELGMEPDNDPVAGSSQPQNGIDTSGEDDLGNILRQLEGNKCRAPFRFDSGKVEYHNAMIMSASSENNDENIQVQVLFTNPTILKMKTCAFFMDDTCRFSKERCKFSHGYPVSLTHLKDFEEPEHLEKESSCLRRIDDDLWQECIVESISEDAENCQLVLRILSSNESVSEDLVNVIPFIKSTSFEEESDDDDLSVCDDPRDFDNDCTGAAELFCPNYESEQRLQTSSTDALATWEVHTKGIGSKLLKMMGYVWGQGLGLRGEGIVTPIEARIVPAGKSLDVIMQMREKDAEKDPIKQKRKADARKAIRDAKIAAGYHKAIKPAETMFSFLNHQVGRGITSSSDDPSKASGSKVDDGSASISKQKEHNRELKTLSKASLNVSALKAGDEVRKAENELTKLQKAVERNKGRDAATTAVLQSKCDAQESLLRTLRAKEASINREQSNRSSDKKLTVF